MKLNIMSIFFPTTFDYNKPLISDNFTLNSLHNFFDVDLKISEYSDDEIVHGC